jgi:uncharacterized lipoprotein YajG
MKNTLLILAAAALMLAGCKPDQPAASLEIDKTALAFDKEGNEIGRAHV